MGCLASWAAEHASKREKKPKDSEDSLAFLALNDGKGWGKSLVWAVVLSIFGKLLMDKLQGLGSLDTTKIYGLNILKD